MGSVKNEIARNLNYYRKKKGLTQRELADRLGVKHNAVSSWENGKNSIDIEFLFRICEILDISVGEMYGRFGSGGDENASFTTEEREYIKKYRLLDERGKKAVNALLDVEYRYLQTDTDIAKRVIPFISENSTNNVREIPVYVAPAAAGIPLPIPTEDYELWEVGDDVPPEASFGIRLCGDSMRPRFEDGQIVWVKQQPDLAPGEIGIFTLNAEALCKKLEYRGNKPYLISINRTYA
ncbi:MAG TPA: XRE family transcriptional regulator, partial [Firmicutes bacterium]|nr:XRE family transcriptional regulator [Bacillota bacterium]